MGAAMQRRRTGVGRFSAVHDRAMENPFRRRRRRRRDRGCDACDVADCGCDLFLLSPLLLLFRVLPGALLPSAVDAHTPRSRSLAGRAGARLIRSYQLHVSAGRPAVCNLTPSCSRYGLRAVSSEGLIRGTRLTWARTRECGREARRRRGEAAAQP